MLETFFIICLIVVFLIYAFSAFTVLHICYLDMLKNGLTIGDLIRSFVCSFTPIVNTVMTLEKYETQLERFLNIRIIK